MDELEMAAMEQMMGLPGTTPADGMDGGGEAAPPGYTMVYVPDAVLPAVMELVAMAETGGGAMGAGSYGAGSYGAGAYGGGGYAAPMM